LKMQQIDEARLDELCLGHWSGHAQDGLVLEEHASFRHRADIASEAEGRKPFQELAAEAAAAREPGEVGLGEARPLEETDHLLQASRQQEVTTRRQLPDKELEYCFVRCPLVEINLQHVELVEVSQEQAVVAVHHHFPSAT